MHEWGLTADVVEEVKNQAAKNNINKVTKIQIGLGKKADLSERAFRTCFKVLAKDTIMEKAKLQFTKRIDHIITVNTIVGRSARHGRVRRVASESPQETVGVKGKQE